MVAIAIVVRSLFIVALMIVVLRKAWPAEMLGTPLARLTLGTVFGGFIRAGIGLSIESFLIWRLLSLPDKDERHDWAGAWVVFAFIAVFFVSFPFWFIDSGKKNAIGDFISGVVLTILGWLMS